MKKKWLWLLLPLILAVGLGIWFGLSRRSSAPVKVYDFNVAGMTGFWGDSKECYGPVSTDKIQTVFLSEKQEITKVHVALGDVVKKGDMLLSLDTTLNDLALERKRLAVEKAKVKLKDAQDELVKIKNMKPFVPREPEPPSENLGEVISGSQFYDRDYAYSFYDGSSAGQAIICWIPEGLNWSGSYSIFDVMRSWLGELRAYNSGEEEPRENPAEVGGFYCVLKSTAGDRELAPVTTFQGVYVDSDNRICFFFDASGLRDNDPTAPDEDDYVEPEQDDSSGYTYAEIQTMKKAKEKEIKALELELKNADAAYQIAQKEMGDGNIYAQTDGRITELITAEEALAEKKPVLKLSGGGGFYIRGTVSELDRDNLVIGQTVSVSDWSNGGFYDGSILSVGDFPMGGNRGGNGNPNVSYYPFTVFVDESADLAAGNYVSVQYSAQGASDGLYLQLPFVRSEKGEHYVYVRGENGRLEKRTVATGKCVWNSYLQILSGLTADDKIAFPYGKDVHPGAKTELGDGSDLYG